jgi:hypothetical protein
MPEVLSKIEQWWMITVAAKPRLNFNDKKMNEAGTIRDKIMTLRLLADIASGLEEESETRVSQNSGYNHDGLAKSPTSALRCISQSFNVR